MFLKILFILAFASNQILSAQISSIIFNEHFDQCGVMSKSAGLIQGGQGSRQNQFPWIAIVSVKDESDQWDQNGSGSLISRRHVLAKSRYVATLDENNKYVPISADNVEIYLGTTKYGDLSQIGSKKVGVSKIKLYSESRRLDAGWSIYNFAILTLERNVIFNDFIKPVCLWNSDVNQKMYPGQQMMVVGYGRDLSGQISKIRKHVPVQITNSTDCATEYKDGLSDMYESSFFCVKEVVKDHGPCKFDTQLYVKVDSVWYLRGELVTARINPDTLFCEVSFPIAVENIEPYVNWIYRHIKKDLIEIYVNSQNDKLNAIVDVEEIVN